MICSFSTVKWPVGECCAGWTDERMNGMWMRWMHRSSPVSAVPLAPSPPPLPASHSPHPTPGARSTRAVESAGDNRTPCFGTPRKSGASNYFTHPSRLPAPQGELDPFILRCCCFPRICTTCTRRNSKGQEARPLRRLRAGRGRSLHPLAKHDVGGPSTSSRRCWTRARFR